MAMTLELFYVTQGAATLIVELSQGNYYKLED